MIVYGLKRKNKEACKSGRLRKTEGINTITKLCFQMSCIFFLI